RRSRDPPAASTARGRLRLRVRRVRRRHSVSRGARRPAGRDDRRPAVRARSVRAGQRRDRAGKPAARAGSRRARARGRGREGGGAVVMGSERGMGAGELSYEYANMLIEGLAGLRADALDAEAVPLVLWDGREGAGRGGTAATVEHWRRGGRKVEVIDLAEIA